MTRLVKGSILFSAIILLGMSFVSCTNGGNRTPTTGTLELNLIDKPGAYQEVVINIIEVQVHHETNGWITLSGSDLNVPLEVNLVDLVGGTMAYLGASELEPGHYDQMRLILDDTDNANYIVVEGDPDPQTLKIPSGYTTGIKLVNGFDIVAAGATELILDFDVDKSIVKAGNSGKYLLKPTIKVVDTVANSVTGNVQDESTNPLPGAKISAQEYNDTLDPIEEKRIVEAAGTFSDDTGDYFMYLPLLPPDALPYNIVAVLPGYSPSCEKLPTAPESIYNMTGEFIADFTLVPIGTESGEWVTFYTQVQGLVGEESVTISIRQNYDGCGLIEVAAFNRGNISPPDELITLPAGDYQIVIVSEGGSTLGAEWTGEVTGEQLIDLDFALSPLEISVAPK